MFRLLSLDLKAEIDRQFILGRKDAHVSQEPGLGFTRHDCPRGIPLPVSPSPRCCHAKACVAAHDGLYC